MYQKTETVYNKEIRVGTDQDKRNIYIELTIEERNDKRQTVTHATVESYKILSLSGYIRKSINSDWYSGGQIQDDIKEIPSKRLKIEPSDRNIIVDTWEKWHLNDMQPNCIHQDSFNCNVDNFNELAASETAKCPAGYNYGSAWLITELPAEVEKEIISVFEKY